MTPEREPHAMRPLGPAAPACAAAAGLILGWLVRPVATALDRTPPLVPWGAALLLAALAVLLGLTALATRRALTTPGRRLEPQRAVNRLVAARACLVAGALVAGGYAGYAAAWLGLDTTLGQQRLERSLVAALAAVLLAVAAVALERACRVRIDEPEP